VASRANASVPSVRAVPRAPPQLCQSAAPARHPPHWIRRALAPSAPRVELWTTNRTYMYLQSCMQLTHARRSQFQYDFGVHSSLLSLPGDERERRDPRSLATAMDAIAVRHTVKLYGSPLLRTLNCKASDSSYHQIHSTTSSLINIQRSIDANGDYSCVFMTSPNPKDH
jgi:hypothetical protein